MDIKSMIGNVTNKAGSIAKTAVKKTGEAAESAKLAITLKSEQNKLDRLFTTLGKLFYEQAKGTDVRAQVAAQIMEIDEQKQVIDELKVIIAENNDKIICVSCGKDIDIDDAFCPVCGKKVEPKLLEREKTEESPIESTNEAAL